VQLRETDDRSALTVMSDTYSADGLFRSDWGPLDVLALRHLYGTRSLGSGDSTWTLGARESLGQTVLIDDGGIDTLDASRADQRRQPGRCEDGKLSSVGVTAAGFNGRREPGPADGHA
jgi:hypothetical protein